MLNFNRRTKIFVSREPTDMRSSYDTLFSKAKGGIPPKKRTRDFMRLSPIVQIGSA